MLEKDIEKALCNRIKALGGLCEKFTSPQKKGVPDRLITLPNNEIIFVELKAPNKRPTALQVKDHGTRRNLGCIVLVIDSLEGIDHAFPL